RGGNRAHHGGNQPQRHPEAQQPPAAPAVRERPNQQLPHGHAHHVGGDGELHHGGARPQILTDQRQGGQVHVRTQRPTRGEQREARQGQHTELLLLRIHFYFSTPQRSATVLTGTAAQGVTRTSWDF